MKYFILAAGYGKRAQPLSLEKAKPAFPLGGIPLIRLIIDQLEKKGCLQGYVNVHHLPDTLLGAIGEDHLPTIFVEEQLSGSLILKRSLPFGDDFLLVLNGDIYMDIPLEEMASTLASSKADGVLLVKSGEPGYSQLSLQNGFLEGISLNRSAKGTSMYAGAALFTPKAVETIHHTNFFDSFSGSQIRLFCLQYTGIWLDIGTPASYYRANWIYKNHVADHTLNALSTGVSLSEDSHLSRSVVWEDSTIGGASSLSECIITANLNLNGVVAKKSLVTSRGIFPWRS